MKQSPLSQRGWQAPAAWRTLLMAALCVIGLQLILAAPGQILPNSYQEVVRESLDRESDSGMHLYVQYK